MAKAVRIHEPGDSSVLKVEDVDVADPGPGEIRLKQTACGLNYIDIYMRSGVYPLQMPATLGMEAAGVVTAVGPDVTDFKEGDRVAYPHIPGAYMSERTITAWKAVKLPDSIDDATAAGMMLKGMTVQYLVKRTYKIQSGDPVLVYAAAGGVGQILCQWAKHLGATVIGCVGTEAKADIAKAAGADHTILYDEEDIVARVKEITGDGVAVVYDSVGQATFERSLDALRPFGMLVNFGNSGGVVEPVKPAILAPKGSLYLTRPTLATHTATPELLKDGASQLFDVVTKGVVKVHVNKTYPLADVATAHEELEGRRTTGSTVLIP